MNLAQIEKMVENLESTELELKSSTSSMKSIAHSLCGYLNAEGGTILIGVTDKHKIIGQSVEDSTKLEIANMLKKFESTADIKVDYVKLSSGRYVIVMQAYPDPQSVPYCFDGRPYERGQANKDLMSQAKYQQLLMKRNITPIFWEDLPSDTASIQDLDDQEIKEAVGEGIRKKLLPVSLGSDTTANVLTRLKLLKEGVPTNAAVALFFKSDGEQHPFHYIQCVLKMARFKGLEKGKFLDSRHLYGNAFYLLREAESFINRNTAVESRIEGKLQRIDEFEYPTEAVREALINALVHRDYSSVGSSVTLIIYDDRLEVTNTGLLPAGLSVEELKTIHGSFPRNPNMLKMFYKRGFIESLGMGTQQIVKLCIDSGMKEPDFIQSAGTFTVRLWSKHYKKGRFSVGLEEKLTERQENILKVLSTGSAMGAAEIFSQILSTGISLRTLKADLSLLKKLGIIEQVGKGPTTMWKRRAIG